MKPHIQDQKIIIQGFGNVGYWAAKFFIMNGAKIVGIGERDVAVYNPEGLDIDALDRYRKKTGGFAGYPDAEIVPESAKILEYDCDILIPAALELQIHTGNVDKIKARMIGEAANGPITPKAHDILVKKGVAIIPDLLLNAGEFVFIWVVIVFRRVSRKSLLIISLKSLIGGVTVSYFEWLKNLSHVRFGRMTKKWDESSKSRLVSMVEEATGRKLSDSERRRISKGGEESELVYSGLEDTMVNACMETRMTAAEKVSVTVWGLKISDKTNHSLSLHYRKSISVTLLSSTLFKRLLLSMKEVVCFS